MKRFLKLLDSSLSTLQSGQAFLRFLFLCSGAVLTALSSESLRGIYKNLAGDLVHSSLRE